MAFLDYMGVPVRRASSHIPTSKEMLEMHFWPMTGLTLPLITLVPEQDMKWGNLQISQFSHNIPIECVPCMNTNLVTCITCMAVI